MSSETWVGQRLTIKDVDGSVAFAGTVEKVTLTPKQVLAEALARWIDRIEPEGGWALTANQVLATLAERGYRVSKDPEPATPSEDDY